MNSTHFFRLVIFCRRKNSTGEMWKFFLLFSIMNLDMLNHLCSLCLWLQAEHMLMYAINFRRKTQGIFILTDAEEAHSTCISLKIGIAQVRNSNAAFRHLTWNPESSDKCLALFQRFLKNLPQESKLLYLGLLSSKFY